MHLDHTAFFVHGESYPLGNPGSEAGMLGNAPALADRNGFTPPGLFRYRLEHASGPLVVLQSLQAKLKRILSCSMGQLIDEGFNGKRIGAILDCTPGETGDGKIGHEEFNIQVRYFILDPVVPHRRPWGVCKTPKAIIMDSVLDGVGIDGPHNRDSGGLVEPAGQPALSVKAALNPMRQ